MESAFLTVLNMSITAGYVILVILLIRFLLRRAPKKYSYLLWAAAGFRLCCPISVRAVFSLFNLRLFDLGKAQESSANTLQYISRDVGLAAAPQMTSGLSAIGGSDGTIPLPAPAGPMQSANPMQVILWAGALVWCIGMAVMLLYGVVSYAAVAYRMRNAVLLKENIYQSEKVRSPFLLGLLRPKIYIPYGLEESMQRYVLYHEQYHIRRGDHVVKCFAFLLLALHWFNPLCWLAFFLMGKDMEMSCDEKVLSSGKNIRKVYSMALLSFAANRRFPTPGPLAFGESGAKSRIQNVLKWKRPKKAVCAAAMLLCVTILAACAVNPSRKDSPGDEVSDVAAEALQQETESEERGNAAETEPANVPPGDNDVLAADAQTDGSEETEQAHPDTMLLADRADGMQRFYVGEFASWDMSGAMAGRSISLDLDGDGTPEDISLSSEYPLSDPWADGSRYYCREYDLSINGTAYRQYGDYVEQTLFALTPDGHTLLLGTFDLGPSDDPVTRFFRYASGALEEVGSVPGDLKTLQIGYDGVIRCPKRTDLLRTAYVWNDWYWDGSRIVMRQDGEYAFVNGDAESFPLQLSEPLQVYAEKEEGSPSVTLQPQVVREVKTDLNEWVYLQGEDGTEGWLRVESGTIPALNDKLSSEVFEGAYFYD